MSSKFLTRLSTACQERGGDACHQDFETRQRPLPKKRRSVRGWISYGMCSLHGLIGVPRLTRIGRAAAQEGLASSMR